jgi:hypothetical protein
LARNDEKFEQGAQLVRNVAPSPTISGWCASETAGDIRITSPKTGADGHATGDPYGSFRLPKDGFAADDCLIEQTYAVVYALSLR